MNIKFQKNESIAFQDSIKVYLRMRPKINFNENDEIWMINKKQKSLRLIPDKNNNKLYTNEIFQFDDIYEKNSKTECIFIENLLPLVESIFQGFNGTILSYGQTTSGKTHTIIGNENDNGIILLTMKHIINLINANKENEYKLEISYLEIYNESIYDLLSEKDNCLKLQESSLSEMKIIGQKKQIVNNLEQTLILLQYGENKRVYKQTNLNENSSRSHTIFKIYLESKSLNKIKKGCINIVDLAGSERLDFENAKKYGTTEENCFINKSLLTLQKIISILSKGKKDIHVPYRDSKLTRILSDSLGGNSKTAIIFCISPSSINYYQSLSTIRYSQKAKKIKNIIKKIEEFENNNMINQNEGKIIELNKKIENLEKYIKSLENTIKEKDEIIKINEKIKFNSFYNNTPEISAKKSINNLDRTSDLKLEKTDLSIQKNKENDFNKENILKSLDKITPKFLLNDKLNFIQSKLYIWGAGKNGRLGNSSEKNEKIPKKIKNIKFIDIALGYHHSCGIDNQGKLFMWGKGNEGQLGLGSNEDVWSPFMLGNLSQFYIDKVSCGWQHTICITINKIVFSWGFGEDGQLGHGDGKNINSPKKIEFFNGINVCKIATGHSHSAAITEKGELYMWGCNIDYRLMINDDENRLSPELVDIIEDNKLIKVNEVSLGVSHSAIITNEGKLYTGGKGTDGNLGVNLNENNIQNTYIKYVEEKNKPDNLINSFQKFNPLIYVKEFNNKNIAISVSCGDNYTLVLNDNLKLFYFGKNIHNINSQNQYYPILFEELQNENIIQISAGCKHAAALTQKGELYIWGFNFYNQVGIDNSKQNYLEPTLLEINPKKMIKKIVCSYFHSAALIS